VSDNLQSQAATIDRSTRGGLDDRVRFVPAWLERLLGPNAAPAREMEAAAAIAPVFRPTSQVVRNALDIPAAIAAHLAWKKRLEVFLGSDCRDVLDPLNVCRDDRCELGRWIHGLAAQRYGGVAGYHQLRAAHADFHCAAARIVMLAQARRDVQAYEEFRRGEFARASVRIQSELAKLYLK
jgi:hypothetical protein